MSIQPTGIWEQDIADTGHIFSYRLAKWIAEYLPKDVHVNDLGCGKGTYLTYLYDRGFRQFSGVEGFPLTDFEVKDVIIKDLSKPFELEKRGNTLCLEVIEHVPNKYADVVFDNICKNTAPGHKIITSCAIPGQGGDGHINCRTNLWVIQHMKNRGFNLNIDASVSVRSVIEEQCAYFRETLLIFE